MALPRKYFPLKNIFLVVAYSRFHSLRFSVYSSQKTMFSSQLSVFDFFYRKKNKILKREVQMEIITN